MATTVVLDGLHLFKDTLTDIQKKADAYMLKAVREMAQVVIEDARKEFTTVALDTQGGERLLGKGEKLLKGEKLSRKGAHQGGDRPNIRTGYLARSIRADFSIIGIGRAQAEIGPRAAYGRRIELGYPGGEGRGQAKTRAFPFLRPGLEKAMPEITEIYERNMAAAWRA